jgi:DNA-binding LacI/PurR family transcriptional regulator/signal transduction histidine kinase/DNA-binding NarL/FixJ family response regulator
MKKKRSGKSRPTLGVFTTWFYGYYQLELYSGIEEAARSHNARLVYFSGRSPHSPYPYENSHNIVYDAALNASLDGLILLSPLANYCDDDQLKEFILRYEHIPVVTINFRASIGNAVLTNNVPGLGSLMKHLIDEHGYRKLAFVKGPKRSPEALERYEVYRSALSANGIRFDPRLVTEGSFTFPTGQDAVHTFLDERGLHPGKDIEAIVCANDAMAIGAIDALYERGLHVPHDMAVTGFDNSNDSTIPKLPLTSVKMHLHEIGYRAVLNLLDYEPDREPYFFDSELVIRRSCGCRKPEGQAGKRSMVNKQVTAGSPDSDVYKKDLEFIHYKIAEIIDNLKAIQKRTEFTDWIRSNLPILGINSTWLFIYSEIPSHDRTYTLLAGYDMKKQGETYPEKKITEKAIFDDILYKKPNRFYCILPLSFKEEQYGLLAMEVNLSTSLPYDVSNHIGSSIKNILLGEEVTTVNRQLVQSNEQRTQFFINVAHETKTPLTLIQNYLALYMEEHKPDEKLLIIKQNIDLLLDNMLNFLDVEKLQKGETIYRHDEFVDLSEGVRRKSALFQPLSAKKNTHVIIGAEDRVIIRIDPLALDRILNNLLDNAVKYTQTGGRITLDVFREKDKAMLRVSDNGPGLPAVKYEHIFEPYYLLSKKKSGQQGIGVGLSIVKKIVDSLGASIAVTKSKGGGACFTIAFTECSTAAEQETLAEFPAALPASPAGQESIEERNITADKRSLFIVDDNIQLLKFLQTALSQSYNVFLARNTAEALVKLRIIPRPDLIVSDIMMNGDDGYKLLSALSAKQKYSDIPFIFLTALNGEKARLKGLDLGAIDYIEKPFSIAALRAKIESVIALRGRQKKQDLERIHHSIDGLFSGSAKTTTDSAKSGFERGCEKFGIVGREREIIRMLTNGLVNKEIASLMNISQRAVEYHITKIYKKCSVNNKFDLMNRFQG